MEGKVRKVHSETINHLSQCANIADIKKTTLDEVLENSRNFPIKFPVYHMMCHSLQRNRKDASPEKLEHFINSAYPLLHESAFQLFINFLEYKKEHGTEREVCFYDKMTVVDLVNRLLRKRAVVFCGSSDSYMLIDGKNGNGGWENIGKSSETPPLTLNNCLSYDEIKLSAFLSVSSQSFFINDGNRCNVGIPCSDPDAFQPDGVIIGLIGSRLEKPGVMEWEEIVISKSQNNTCNGYGSLLQDDGKLQKWRRMWADFYDNDANFPLYEEALAMPDRYKQLSFDGLLFDNDVYKKRITVSTETLLLEAEIRAEQSNMNAYIMVVGIGLGVWRLSSHQDTSFLEAFADCLKRLSPVLKHVSDVHFLWFKKNECGGVKNGEMIHEREDGSGIRIHFSRGAPHSRIKDNKLLVASYAWDGNALPGNEFWDHCLAASGDPAEACCSQVAELHNPHINTKRVCGENLHIASPQWGVIHVAEYARRKLQKVA